MRSGKSEDNFQFGTTIQRRLRIENQLRTEVHFGARISASVKRFEIGFMLKFRNGSNMVENHSPIVRLFR